MSDINDQYNLVFEGPVDDSPDTLRRLKAALLVDMAFSIDKIQEALAKTPYTLITTDNEADLHHYVNLLTAAGGKTCIVKSSDSELDAIEVNHADEPEDLFGDLSIQFDEDELSPTKELLTPTPISENVETMDADSVLDLNDEFENIPGIEQPKIAPLETKADPLKEFTPVSNLDLAFDEEFQDVPKTIIAKQEQPPVQKNPEPEANEETVEFSFTIGEEEKPKAKKAKTYKLSLDEQDESDIPELLEKEPVGPIISLMAKAKDKAEREHVNSLENISSLQDDAQSVDPLPNQLTSTEVPLISLESESHPLLKGKGEKEQHPLASSLQSRSNVLPTVSQQVVEEEKEVLEERAIIAPRHAKKSSIKELIIPILLGLPIILAANWVYFEFSLNQEILSFREKIQNMTSSLIASLPKEEKKEPDVIYHVLTGRYAGEHVYDDRTLEIKGHISIEDKKAKLLVNITTPEPGELTLEQIGRQEKKPIWVKSVTIDEGSYEITSQGVFEGESPARIYLDDNGDGKRFVGTGKISGKIDAEKRVGVVLVSVSYGVPLAKSELSLKKKGVNDFDFSLSGDVVIKKDQQ